MKYHVYEVMEVTRQIVYVLLREDDYTSIEFEPFSANLENAFWMYDIYVDMIAESVSIKEAKAIVKMTKLLKGLE